jgi:hypothetical protein
MITEAAKRELIDWISTLENQSMLEHLMELKNSNESEKIYQVSDLEREGIDAALKSIEEGKGVPHEEVTAKFRKKYPKIFRH